MHINGELEKVMKELVVEYYKVPALLSIFFRGEGKMRHSSGIWERL
jgi:hypothetical protein